MSMLSSFVHKSSSLICEIASTVKSAYTVTARPMIEKRERQKAEAQKKQEEEAKQKEIISKKEYLETWLFFLAEKKGYRIYLGDTPHVLYTADEFCVELDFRLDGQKTQTLFNQLCTSSKNGFYDYINCNLIHSQRDLQTIGAEIYQAEYELANVFTELNRLQQDFNVECSRGEIARIRGYTLKCARRGGELRANTADLHNKFNEMQMHCERWNRILNQFPSRTILRGKYNNQPQQKLLIIDII